MVTNLLPSREEASTVFGDPRSLTISDPVHFGLSVCPSMSLIPFAPFDEAGARNGPISTRCCAREHVKRPMFLALWKN